jgi:hypothetical protein
MSSKHLGLTHCIALCFSLAACGRTTTESDTAGADDTGASSSATTGTSATEPTGGASMTGTATSEGTVGVSDSDTTTGSSTDALTGTGDITTSTATTTPGTTTSGTTTTDGTSTTDGSGTTTTDGDTTGTTDTTTGDTSTSDTGGSSTGEPIACGDTLFATIRDFKTGHPDFETYCCGLVPGLVDAKLGANKKPVFKSVGNPQMLTDAATFAQWYTDVPGVNQKTQIVLNMVEIQPGLYSYTNNNFFPIDDMLWGNQGNGHNFHFTTGHDTS